MARLQLWTLGLMVTLAVSISLAVAEDFGLSVVEAENQRPVEIVKKESNPILFRRKRAWIWNSLYVWEERSVSAPLKLGQVGELQERPYSACLVYFLDPALQFSL